MVSRWMPDTVKSPRLDFNNDPRITWIVVKFLPPSPPPPPSVYSSPTEMMAPLQVIPILVKQRIHLFRSPTYCLLVGAISGPGLIPIMAQGIIRIVAAFCPQRLFESNSNNGHYPGHSNLGTLKITTACPIAALFDSLFFPPKCYEASFNLAQSVDKNCLTTPHLLCCTHRLTRFHLSSQKYETF